MNVKMFFLPLKDKCNYAYYLYFDGMKLRLPLYLYLHPKKALLVQKV
jgi:hypothetical protein